MCCRRASPARSAQRNQPCTKKLSTYTVIRLRDKKRKRADRLGASQYVVGHPVSKPVKKLKSARPIKKNNTLVVREEDLPSCNSKSQYDTTLFLLFRTHLFDCVHAASWRGSWYLQVVSLHLIMDLCPLHYWYRICLYRWVAQNTSGIPFFG